MSEPADVGFAVKFSRFNWSERRALGEALALMHVAALAVRFLPLRLLGRWCSRPIGRPITDPARREALSDLVGWAIDRAAKRSRLRALCFERGLAAQIMLRRRGVDSTLFYGASPGTARPLEAHVWVLAGDHNVTGAPEPGEFATLASFPPGREAHGMAAR